MIIKKLFTPPGWGWRTPFDEIEEMKNRMERLSHYLKGDSSLRRSPGVFPLINVTETADVYKVRAELPGLKPEELDISVTGNRLAISGTRRIAQEDSAARYHRREREAGNFSRMIDLPDHVDSERIAAKLANGVLTVIMPKAASAKPRQIKVG